WNEPNLNREWAGYPPNAAAYVKLLAVCYDAVHRADPNAIVISAGLAPTGGDGIPTDATPDEDYFRAMYAAGLSGHFDVLGLNAPGYKSSPEFPPDDPSLGGNRWQAFRHVEDMRAIMVANGDGAKQIAILEMGWTTDTRPGSPYAWQGVNEELQADYLVGAYRYAAAHWRPWVGLMVTIYLPDPSWTEENEEYWWSIITPGYSPRIKTAFVALANMDRHMDGVDLPEQPAGGSVYKPLPPRKP
ncbi:MAG TPA: hypothetical protein VMT34_05430, partial [Aggregatilineales bacterium]|nr:hypothetical protein [Aggregatilineales bacterium]